MLYLDASALVKRYVEEESSESVLRAMDRASAWSMCRIGYVETVRAVAVAGGRKAVKRFEEDWSSFDVIEVDTALAEHAAQLALSAELHSLDALHLAAALVLPSDDLTVATWDVRLHRAVGDQGLGTLPTSLG
ncbi:MAG TPA: type II toxin-antitoxin system VapC family toxin [Solirubrobacterales bacterium]|nr:type II toxin-antitoxin system VapC family toxin [Solirubrobacterales bacterium]